MEEFWDEPCPARGPGLNHHRDMRWNNKCIECGLIAPANVVKLLPAPKIPGLVEEHTDDTLVEPKQIDPLRADRPPIDKEWDLTATEMATLWVNCIELERRRGYR